MEKHSSALKVMVIDDSKTIRRTAETLLKNVGCEVITADHTVDDGRLQRRRRFIAAGNRITHLWH